MENITIFECDKISSLASRSGLNIECLFLVQNYKTASRVTHKLFSSILIAGLIIFTANLIMFSAEKLDYLFVPEYPKYIV